MTPTLTQPDSRPQQDTAPDWRLTAEAGHDAGGVGADGVCLGEGAGMSETREQLFQRKPRLRRAWEREQAMKRLAAKPKKRRTWTTPSPAPRKQRLSLAAQKLMAEISQMEQDGFKVDPSIRAIRQVMDALHNDGLSGTRARFFAMGVAYARARKVEANP